MEYLCPTACYYYDFCHHGKFPHCCLSFFGHIPPLCGHFPCIYVTLSGHLVCFLSLSGELWSFRVLLLPFLVFVLHLLVLILVFAVSVLYIWVCVGFFLKLFISFCHLFIRIYCHSPVIFIFILLVWLSVFVLLFSQCTSLCSHFIFQQFWGFCHCIISQCSLFFNVCPFKAFFHLLWFWILFLESLCFCCCQFVSAMTHWDHLASQ